MVTKISKRNVYDSFCNSEVSQRNENPPWCSSGKVSEKRKLSHREIQSSYPLRENIWEYLYEGENLKWHRKRRNTKANKHEKCYRRKTKLIFLILLSMGGIIGTLWKLYPVKCSKMTKAIMAKTKQLSFGWINSPVSEDCCHRMRHLALELSRAERILRNTFRLRTTAISKSRVKSVSVFPLRDSRYIDGITVAKGSDTEEWTGRVTLWGVVPLWRAAPPPHTVLALRKPTPADCWPFSGSSGELHIRLPKVQRIQSISVEHVQPDTARSAPRRFVVFGILANDTQIEVINSDYRHQGPAKQFFIIRIDAPMRGVIFRVLTNHGNLKYTCIYRVHLYGNSQHNYRDDYD